MKEIWVSDVQQRRKQFFDDQDKNSMLILNYFHGDYIALPCYRLWWKREPLEFNYNQNG